MKVVLKQEGYLDMKKIYAVMAISGLAAFAGCSQGTSGGPGATPESKERMSIGQPEDTFRLSVPSTALNQGQSKTLIVGINRGTNFSEEVTLKLSQLPKGVTLNPASPVIKVGEMETKLAITATADAALGDFTYTVTGHPANGVNAVAEAKLTVNTQNPRETADAAADDARANAEEYTDAMQEQLDQLAVRYDELENRADNAVGQAKTELDMRLVDAKAKMDVAETKLDELRNTGVERWETVKNEVEIAFDNLRKSVA